MHQHRSRKLRDMDVTFESYSNAARRFLPWDDFPREAHRAKSLQDIFQLLVDTLVPLGARQIVYAFQDGDRLSFHSTLDDSWKSHYKSRNYHEVDPGVRHAWLRGAGPTAMGRGFLRFRKYGFSDPTKRLMPSQPWSRETNELQEDSAAINGFEIGFMIPFSACKGMGVGGCSFGTSMGHKEFDGLYAHHGGQIVSVLKDFHEFFQSALQDKRRGEDHIKLDRREIDILQMLSDGLGKHEIAEKISRGKRMVDYALASARIKLNAGQSDHLAVRIALDLGWIY